MIRLAAVLPIGLVGGRGRAPTTVPRVSIADAAVVEGARRRRVGVTERDEHFTVTLCHAGCATVGDGTDAGTIVDDDALLVGTDRGDLMS